MRGFSNSTSAPGICIALYPDPQSREDILLQEDSLGASSGQRILSTSPYDYVRTHTYDIPICPYLQIEWPCSWHGILSRCCYHPTRIQTRCISCCLDNYWGTLGLRSFRRDFHSWTRDTLRYEVRVFLYNSVVNVQIKHGNAQMTP